MYHHHLVVVGFEVLLVVLNDLDIIIIIIGCIYTVSYKHLTLPKKAIV